MYNPSDIHYCITIECNQKCSKCSFWKYSDQSSRLNPKKLIEALLAIPTAKNFFIAGGEPLLFKNEIYEILSGISDTDVLTVIITNGVAMDPIFIDRISKSNIHISVSIDTMDTEFWSFVRGSNSYDLVFKNLDYAISKLKPNQISIQSVISKETQPHIEQVAEYAKSKKISHSVQRYISEGFNGSWTPILSKNSNSLLESEECGAIGRNLSILYSGEVYTCFQQKLVEGCQRPVGNLNIDRIEDILNSSYIKSLENKLKGCNLPCKVLRCNRVFK